MNPTTLVIFGASGDLTRRKLVPALFTLHCRGKLPRDVQLLGVARSALSEDEFRSRLQEGLARYGRIPPESCHRWTELAGRVGYLSGGYDDPETYRHLAERLDGTASALFYLAIPPDLVPTVVTGLDRAGLNRSRDGWRRLVVEKPFGRDGRSAAELTRTIHRSFQEEQVYRIDHYLGKETVQNILAFRFANAVFEPLWSRAHIDHVQLTVAETVGVEHRAGYYDRVGVVRDMLQNHLLQLLTLVAMEAPARYDPRSLRDEKVKVLQSIRPLEPEDCRWGQYRGYLAEEGVPPDSRTPTFVAARLRVDNWRWSGVPFYLRTGKNLGVRTSAITLQFNRVPHQIFGRDHRPPPNRITLTVQPDEGAHLAFQTKVPGAGMSTAEALMDFLYADRVGPEGLPEAYERLLLDALKGDASLFARDDEIDRSWELVDPVLEWYEGQPSPPLFEYEPDSPGPAEAAELLQGKHRGWWEEPHPDGSGS